MNSISIHFNLQLQRKKKKKTQIHRRLVGKQKSAKTLGLCQTHLELIYWEKKNNSSSLCYCFFFSFVLGIESLLEHSCLPSSAKSTTTIPHIFLQKQRMNQISWMKLIIAQQYKMSFSFCFDTWTRSSQCSAASSCYPLTSPLKGQDWAGPYTTCPPMVANIHDFKKN